ncbi:MAG TPA: hypothetical protein VLV85_10865 [Stellaceae bacterium]|jgi:hypothetical protein|nr:hypothetical protein [Stellaceae bacterium]
MFAGLAKLKPAPAKPDVPPPAPLAPADGMPVHEQQGRLRRAFAAPAASAFLARFIVLNLIGVALVLACWAEGLLYRPYTADHSGMCWLITALFGWGLVCVLRRDWQSVRWSGNALVYLGMVGTVLGLIITVSDLSADKGQSFADFKQVVTSIYVGSATALYTNLLACIGYLWLGTNAHLLARQEV